MIPPMWQFIKFCLIVLRAGLIQSGSGHLLLLLYSSPGVGVPRLTLPITCRRPDESFQSHPKPQAGGGQVERLVRATLPSRLAHTVALRSRGV